MEVRGPTHDPNLAQVSQDQQIANRSESKGKSTLGSNSSEGEQVSLTSRAGELQALEEKIAELPVVDTKRVEAIQKAIAAGNYQVEPAKVADQLLNFESNLGSS